MLRIALAGLAFVCAVLPVGAASAASIQDQAVYAAALIAGGNKIASKNHSLPWNGGYVPYSHGGGWGSRPGPSAGSDGVGVDCGGLTRWVYALTDVGDVLKSPPGGQQENVKAFVTTTNPVPGDLVFFFHPGSSASHHVGIYVGSGKMIDALTTGTVVREDPIGHAGERIVYKHYCIGCC